MNLNAPRSTSLSKERCVIRLAARIRGNFYRRELVSHLHY